MPLLLLPLFLLLLAAAWVLLLPLSLRLRYRQGTARRRTRGWLLRINAWAWLLSVPGFVLAAWWGTRWVPDALAGAAAGLAAGALLGALGLALTRFERIDAQLYYTPNRWLVLLVTGVLALRIALALWWGWHRDGRASSAGATWHWLLGAGSLWLAGGVLLGYAALSTWGLLWRHRRATR